MFIGHDTSTGLLSFLGEDFQSDSSETKATPRFRPAHVSWTFFRPGRVVGFLGLIIHVPEYVVAQIRGSAKNPLKNPIPRRSTHNNKAFRSLPLHTTPPSLLRSPPLSSATQVPMRRYGARNDRGRRGRRHCFRCGGVVESRVVVALVPRVGGSSSRLVVIASFF